MKASRIIYSHCLPICGFLIATLIAQTGWAIELGAPSIRSFLGQPLDVRIVVEDADPESMQGALVSLAPVSEWVRSGLSLLPNDLTLKVTFEEEGDNIFVSLKSDQAIREPVLQVLLNLQITGQNVDSKPFILFLDPAPGARQARVTRNTNLRSRRNQSGPSTVLSSPASKPPPASSVTTSSRVDVSGQTYGPVREGETMWGIAESIAQQVGFTPQQIMLALQQANPDALEDPSNVNTLLSNVTLHLPNVSTMARTDHEEALTLIEDQNRAWRAGERGARLELLRGSADSKLSVESGDNVLAMRISRLEEELIAARRENEALRDQVGQLENTVSERETELSISSRSLSDLQRELESARSLSSIGSDQTSNVDLGAADTTAGQIIDETSQRTALDNLIPAQVDELGAADATEDGIETEGAIAERLFAGDDAQADNPTEETAESYVDQTNIEPAQQVAETITNNSDEAESAVAPAAENANAIGRWNWPIWESQGWKDTFSWLPVGLLGFALLALGLLLVIAIPIWLIWRSLSGSGRTESSSKSADFLDRIVAQRNGGDNSAEDTNKVEPVLDVSADIDDDTADLDEDFIVEEVQPEIDVDSVENDGDSINEHGQSGLEGNDLLEPLNETDWSTTIDDSELDDEISLDEVFVVESEPDDSTEQILGEQSDINDLPFSLDSDNAENMLADVKEDADKQVENVLDSTSSEDIKLDNWEFDLDEVTETETEVDEILVSLADTASDTVDTVSEEKNNWDFDLNEVDSEEPDNEALFSLDDVEVTETVAEIAEPTDTRNDMSGSTESSVDEPLRLSDEDRAFAEDLKQRTEPNQDDLNIDDVLVETTEDTIELVSDTEEQTSDETNSADSDPYSDDSIDVKLDLARAYLAMGDREAMLTILDEVGDAGSDQQRAEVENMRGQLSG